MEATRKDSALLLLESQIRLCSRPAVSNLCGTSDGFPPTRGGGSGWRVVQNEVRQLLRELNAGP